MTPSTSSRNLPARIWDFFASVKLALTTLAVISLTSIIGTVIPQKESLAWYARKYGPQTAQFLDLFSFTDMFGSFWFRALLGLLSANLIICSIQRFPSIRKQIIADNLATPPKRLTGMRRNVFWTVPSPATAVLAAVSNRLQANGWRLSSRATEDGMLLFSQKTAWSRWGVLIVHTSILVILIGAVLGSAFGFKGSILLPEGQKAGRFQAMGTASFIDLGFEVRCDAFSIAFYPNGMPKEYRSDLTILEQGKEVLRRPIKVNTPLTYKGVTFYQSSYEGYKDFVITLTDMTGGERHTFYIPYQQQMEWPEKKVRFGVVNAEVEGDRIGRIKIWFADDSGEPAIFWADPEKQISIDRQGKRYLLSAKQMYATGLQIAKDPGVWWVYCGCMLLLAGLFVTFFLSHRKIWLLVTEQNGATGIRMAGSTNKNKTGFDREFSALVETVKNQPQ